MNEPTAKDDGWPRGWEGHELAQLRYWKQLPLAEKLAWLEEAHKLAMHLNRQPDSSKNPPPS